VTELSVTDLRNRLLEVIRRVEVDGEEVVVVRHGRRVARLVPEPTPASTLLGVDVGRVTITDPADDLLSTGEVWEEA
jgi:prevent-host-death family protein